MMKSKVLFLALGAALTAAVACDAPPSDDGGEGEEGNDNALHG